MNNQKIISYVIPTLNSSKTILKCLESVKNQKVPKNWTQEIIIIDNFSTDKTVELISNNFSSVVIKSESRKGPAFCRNLGIEIASGTYIAFIDSDVVLDINWTSISLTKMQSGEYAGSQGEIIPQGVGLLHSLRRSINQSSNKGMNNHLYSIFDSYLTPAINTAACLYSKKWLNSVGGFNNKLQRLEDRDLSTRIFLRGGILCTNTSLAYVHYDKNIYQFLRRYYLNGMNFTQSIMARLPSHKHDTNLFPRQTKVYSTLKLIFRYLFRRGLKKASKNKSRLSSPVKRIPSRVTQMFLEPILKKVTSPYIRVVELESYYCLIHIKKVSLYLINKNEFKETVKSLPTWVYD